jgi:hypothetical protein
VLCKWVCFCRRVVLANSKGLGASVCEKEKIEKNPIVWHLDSSQTHTLAINSEFIQEEKKTNRKLRTSMQKHVGVVVIFRQPFPL